MAIFNSYVKLPEGTTNLPTYQPSNQWLHQPFNPFTPGGVVATSPFHIATLQPHA